MNAEEWMQKLRKEGFKHVYVWEDSPSAFYPDHTHPGATAHAILSGEMTVTFGRRTETIKAGERFDVPAQAAHSAHIGPTGCRLWRSDSPGEDRSRDLWGSRSGDHERPCAPSSGASERRSTTPVDRPYRLAMRPSIQSHPPKVLLDALQILFRVNANGVFGSLEHDNRNAVFKEP